ncbi:MAG: hypothetical protein ACKPJO_09555, partial [Dolichospermum sp.]
EILEKGETLLVQISKEPIGTKGPKLTTCFTLPGRFIILMPNIPKIGISKKLLILIRISSNFSPITKDGTLVMELCSSLF